MIAQRRRAPGDAVDPDPLATGRPGGAGADDRELQGVTAEMALDPRQVGPPADELAVGRGPVAATPGEQDDRFEEARLPGRVRAPDELRSGAEGGVEGGVPAQVAQADGVEQDPPQEVVRTGITTWT